MKQLSIWLAFILVCWPAIAVGDIYRQAGPAVISLRVNGMLRVPENGRREWSSRGTGFVVSADGYVLTAAHVVRGSDVFEPGALLIEGTFPVLVEGALVASGSRVRLQLLGVGQSSDDDVALLRIIDAPPNLPYLRSCDGGAPDEVVRTLGYSFVGTSAGGDGILSIVRGEVSTPSVRGSPLRLNARGAPGLSGSPVLGSSENVVAIFLGEESSLPTAERSSLPFGSRALPSRRAFEVVSPHADGLRGRSYEQTCNIRVGAFLSGFVYTNTLTDRIVGAPLVGRRREIVAEFQAPPGMQFVVESAQERIATGDAGLVINGVEYAWTNDRTRYVVSSDVTLSGGFRLSEFSTRVEIPVIPRTPHVEGFRVQRVVERGDRQTQAATVAAPAGYRFTQIFGIEALTDRGSSNERASIAGDGLSLNVTFDANPVGRRSDRPDVDLMVHALVTPIVG